MKGLDGRVLYVASDLMGFLGCRHSIFLDLVDLRIPLEKAEDNAQMQLIQERGLEHEREYLQSIRDTGMSLVEVPEDVDLQDRVAQTLEAMEQGTDVIYQAALWQATWHGFADFLHRVKAPSSLGDFSYEAMDTKLSRRPEPHHVLQLCVYSDLLETVQGARVGTVDMFQGQEAEVVLISMVTSSGDDLPRHIEFLYSKNRLNVAISRARTLAVLITSPRLLEIACQTIDQMRLVNTLCWVKAYAECLNRCDSLKSEGSRVPLLTNIPPVCIIGTLLHKFVRCRIA